MSIVCILATGLDFTDLVDEFVILNSNLTSIVKRCYRKSPGIMLKTLKQALYRKDYFHKLLCSIGQDVG